MAEKDRNSGPARIDNHSDLNIKPYQDGPDGEPREENKLIVMMNRQPMTIDRFDSGQSRTGFERVDGSDIQAHI
jgi:hypothetical protein